MNETEYPMPASGKPIWLMTLADLALLLVGFLVLVQATQHVGGKALAKGFREGFGGNAAEPVAMPVAAAGLMDFAPGSASLPMGGASLVAWAREAVRDPRVALTITGSTDGSPIDIDGTTGSAAILAADRARAVAALLGPIARGRLTITTTTRPGRRAAMVTIAFSGEPRKAS